MKHTLLFLLALLAVAPGCQFKKGKLYGGTKVGGPQHDRPFPLGQVSDSFWETQQTNAEAADFIFYDHEFVGDTARLTPAAKKHLQSVALRLEHVPFPVVIEETSLDPNCPLDQARHRVIVEQLARLGVADAEERVICANAFPRGITSTEAIQSYMNGMLNTSNRNNLGAGGGGAYR
jgi:hypothetical protein